MNSIGPSMYVFDVGLSCQLGFRQRPAYPFGNKGTSPMCTEPAHSSRTVTGSCVRLTFPKLLGNSLQLVGTLSKGVVQGPMISSFISLYLAFRCAPVQGSSRASTRFTLRA